jgi:membrane-associated PAP2 superfamily phosphatase
MRTFLLLLPGGLSLLTLAAHFLRRGQYAVVAVCLLVFALLFVRRAWAAHVVRVTLFVAALVWARTLVGLMHDFQADGRPWHRMAFILGAVIAVTTASAVLLESAPLRRHFGRVPPDASPRGVS